MHVFIRQLFLQILLTATFAGSSAWAESTVGLPKTLLSYERPEFPAALRQTSTTDGYASVVFLIDADGKIVDAVVLEASHQAFGESVLSVLPTWRFTASSTDDTFARREVLRFQFAAKGVVTSISHREAIKSVFPLSAEEKTPIRTIAWKDLGMPPERLSAPAPKMTPTIIANGGGKVQVSYIIDTDGRVRVPFITNATRPELGVATLAAVKQWQFSSPMQDGLPVLVEDTRSFTFGKN
jgi:outer membrane biosynthesis protein TonB